MLEPGRVALVAGGDPSVAAALARELTDAGMRVVTGQDDGVGQLDAVILNPGATWREHPDAWRECLRLTYERAEAALPQLSEDGRVIACGPPEVPSPGPGYAEFVKARLALGRFLREFAGEPAAAVALWPSTHLRDGERIATFCDAVLAILAKPVALLDGRHVIDLEIAHERPARERARGAV